MSELATPESYESLGKAGSAEAKLREAARAVRQDVLAEVAAMGEDFPKVEVAVPVPDDADRRTIGAVALGHRYLETEYVTGIIIADNSRHAHIGNYSAVLLTPEGMKRVRGSLVMKKNQQRLWHGRYLSQ